MSHYSDSCEKQQQLSRGRSKKRSRWNDEEPDAGEIPESDDTIHNQGTKRLRPTQDSQHSSGSGVIETTTIKSRDEFERERQIRMAALRAETEEDEHQATDHDPTVSQPPVSTTASTKKKRRHRSGDDPQKEEEEEEDEEEEDDSAKMMQELFGIRQFGSSKNTKVATNHTSAAVGTIAKHLKPRKYRQYMNRKNGFNRPLDNI